VNDTYGHPVGDVVLRQLADVLRRCLRRADLPARLGGEEFGVVLVQAEADPLAVAEKLRQEVEQAVFGEAAEPLRINISVGAATWAEKLGTAQALMKTADKALYEAKSRGRNRVALA